MTGVEWGIDQFETSCVTLDYSGETKNSAILGKHVFEAPKDKDYKNTHLLCLQTKSADSDVEVDSWIYTVGGSGTRIPFMSRLRINKRLLSQPDKLRWKNVENINSAYHFEFRAFIGLIQPDQDRIADEHEVWAVGGCRRLERLGIYNKVIFKVKEQWVVMPAETKILEWNAGKFVQN